jgi:hypothetical protein
MTLACFMVASIRRRALRSAAVLAALMAQAGVALAAAPDGCRAVNQGLVDVEVASDETVLRHVNLKKGDALSLAFRSTPGPTGLVTLHTRSGSGRLLLAGPNGTAASFVAEKSGELALLFATEGGWVGSFSVRCLPAAAAADAAAAHNAPAEAQHGVPDGPTLDTGALENRQPGSVQAQLFGKPAAETSQVPATAPMDWLKLEGSRVETLDGASAGPANFGVKLRLQPAITVGMAAQIAQPDSGALAPPTDQAWLVGPVTSLQLGQGLSLDARAAWGASEAGAAAGTEGTERRMLEARLANTQAFGAWRFSPSVMLNYQQEKRHVPDAVAVQSTGAGSVGVRPEVAYRFDLGDSLYVEPTAMIGPTWGLPDAATDAPPEMRLKAETGVTIGGANGTKVQVGGSVEEGGPNAANVWSGRLQLNVPLK